MTPTASPDRPTATVTRPPATPTATPVLDSVEPPAATVEINGRTRTAGIGSYCWWDGGEAQTRLDLAGLPTAGDPLRVAGPFTARFHLPQADPPESLFVSWAAVTAEDLLAATGEQRLWKFSPDSSTGLPAENDVDYEFAYLKSPGLYLIQLSARWKDWGTAEYGFLVQLGPADGGLSLAAPATSFPPPDPQALPALTPLTRLGQGRFTSLAVSPDGHWLAIVTKLGIHMLETASQDEVWFRQFPGHPDQLAFSPDSTRLTFSLGSNTLPVLDAATGQTLMELKGEAGIHGVWSPDGRYILTSGYCEQVLIWNAHTGERIHTLHEIPCNNARPILVNAVWSWNGLRIYVSSTEDFYRQIQAWDVATYGPLAGYQPEPLEHPLRIEVAPSPTQDLFAVLYQPGVALMDGRSGKLVRLLTSDIDPNMMGVCCNWSPDGRLLLAGGVLWEAASGDVIKAYDDFFGLAWMPDGDTLVGILPGNLIVKAVSITSGETLFSLPRFGNLNEDSLVPVWDGETLLTYDGTSASRWDARSGELIDQSATSRPTWATSSSRPLSPDNTRWAEGTCAVSTTSGEQLRCRSYSEGRDDFSAWSPDGQLLVSGSHPADSPTVIWDADTYEILSSLPLDPNREPWLEALAWSPDGNRIAAGGSMLKLHSNAREGVIVLWDPQSRALMHLLTEGMGAENILTLAWSPDSRRLAAGLQSGQIVIWDTSQFAQLAWLKGHVGPIQGLAWSPDGALLASTSADGTLLVWEIP